MAREHSRPQRPRSFWSAPRTATSGRVQRHSGFEWICKHKRWRPEPIRFVRLDSDQAQSDGKSVNRGLPLLDQARGRDSWCWPKGARPLGTRMAREAEVDRGNFVWWNGEVTGRTGSGRKCLNHAHAQSFDPCENLWPGHTPEVHESRTSRHSAHAQSQVWQIWLVLVSICVYSHSELQSRWTWPEVVILGADHWGGELRLLKNWVALGVRPYYYVPRQYHIRVPDRAHSKEKQQLTTITKE